jgi:hypothetical protein
VEITNGAPFTNGLWIEDAIGMCLADFPPKHTMMRSDTHLSTTQLIHFISIEILGMGAFQSCILWVVLEQDLTRFA